MQTVPCGDSGSLGGRAPTPASPELVRFSRWPLFRPHVNTPIYNLAGRTGTFSKSTPGASQRLTQLGKRAQDGRAGNFSARQTALVRAEEGGADCSLPCAWNPACLKKFPSLERAIGTEWALSTVGGRRAREEGGRKGEQQCTPSF